MVLIKRVATGHVGELHDAPYATPTHPHLVLHSGVHMSQILDELDLVKSYVSVLLLDLDRLG